MPPDSEAITNSELSTSGGTRSSLRSAGAPCDVIPKGKKDMWYGDLGVISIGCQNGGPKDNGIVDIKVDLSHLLKDYCSSTHCASVDYFALALRVGGEFADYSPERIHKVRRSRKERYIGCDIDIPVAVWA